MARKGWSPSSLTILEMLTAVKFPPCQNLGHSHRAEVVRAQTLTTGVNEGEKRIDLLLCPCILVEFHASGGRLLLPCQRKCGVSSRKRIISYIERPRKGCLEVLAPNTDDVQVQLPHPLSQADLSIGEETSFEKPACIMSQKGNLLQSVIFSHGR